MTNTANILWFKEPASEWLDALPIGNGRMGVMVFGGIFNEKLALSESTVWSGKENTKNDNKDGPKYLAKIQEALLPPRASNSILNELLDKYKGTMDDFGTSRPFGDMLIDFYNEGTKLSYYKRSLDMSTGIATTEYTIDDISYKREIFASYPAQVIILKISASQKASISFKLNVKPVPYKGGTGFIESHDNTLLYNGKVYDGEMKTHARIVAINVDGIISSDERGVTVNNADEVTLFISMATNYRDNDPVKQCDKDILDALQKDYEQLRTEHIKDFSSQFNRLELSLGDKTNSELSTDERAAAVKSGISDPDLDALWYQYARYLTISASRDNSPLPMHLQGIWNDNLAANMCWTCDFHLDINSQMNQWISTPGNLPQGNIALGNYIKDILVPSGTRTASVQYGKKGWVAHTVANAWGYSSFINATFSIFPTAGAWIASSLWDQYEYFQDKEFLKNVAYPILKEAAIFFIDFLIHYPSTEHLVTAPSFSPEHGKVSVMPTSDRVIVYGLFDSVIKASRILDADIDFRDILEDAMAKLPPLEISLHGQIKEWYEDTTTDGITGHRHMSHLLALFPYDQITLEETPDLAKAAEISINRRISTEGWEETEFTGANLAAFFARLKDGNKAYARINILREKLTAKNLLTLSPAGIAGAETDIFLIDGNMGIAAAVSEMLLQSYRDRLEFLPALPDSWGKGFVKGIAARGAFEIEMSWNNFTLDYVKILSNKGNTCNIIKNKVLDFNNIIVCQIEGEEKIKIGHKFDDNIISFDTIEGKVYEIVSR